MDGFRYFSKPEVERQLSGLLRQFRSAETERESFLDWAWLVATASDAFASQNRAACVELLRDETAALERVIKRRERRLGVSKELECKREFLAYLEHQAEGPQTVGLS